MADSCTQIEECCKPSPFGLLSSSPAPTSDAECGAQECCRGSVFNIPISPIVVFPTCSAMDGFGLWLDGAPMPCESGVEDFSMWFEGIPFVEKSDNY